MPEMQVKVKEDGEAKSTTTATAVDAGEEMTLRVFGVSIGVKRARSEDDLREDLVPFSLILAAAVAMM
ncbi:Hypothetical predicted protein [Olea europaea subsp. europaea]|uniref:Uncharacterized protein n=1 Tax=Olea europaea subsp. europaea TaxID=158383 RepID=A0A8S0T2H3_OLEEU|nr:Hypothetical predicted protein [Olea europaea subsp. europaea]